MRNDLRVFIRLCKEDPFFQLAILFTLIMIVLFAIGAFWPAIGMLVLMNVVLELGRKYGRG